MHPQQQSRIARRVWAAGNRVGAADMIMDAPHPGRSVQGRGPVAEGDHGEVRHGGGEPADGIPAPAMLIGTGDRQRMQRLHQQGPQARHGRGQVSAHPPGDAGGSEKAVVPGAFRHARRKRSRRAIDQAGRGRVQIRRVSQANQLPRRHRSARVGQRPVEPGQVGMDNPQSAQLLTRIGVNDCSRPAADDRIPAAAARGDRAGRQCPSRRTASPVGVPPGRPAVARWRPAALLSPHAARSAAPRRSRAGRP